MGLDTEPVRCQPPQRVFVISHSKPVNVIILMFQFILNSKNKPPPCLIARQSSRMLICPRRCSRTLWTVRPRPWRSTTLRRTSRPTSRRSSTKSTTPPHCIVGRNFGSYVTHETRHFIYFYLGQVAILLFKSG